MRMADSVLLMCWPPAPLERNVSICRSPGFSSTSTSSASGSTATVAVDVWMRPCDSVSGTRCTRWTPLSNLKRDQAPSPITRKLISLKPPSSVSFVPSTSILKPRRSAYIEYMRNSTAANRADSSPPAPPRISTITFLSSFSSRGSNSTRSRCERSSSAAFCVSNSSCASARSSLSLSLSKRAFASSSAACAALYCRKQVTTGSSFLRSFISAANAAGSDVTAGSHKVCSSSQKRASTAPSFSIMRPPPVG